MTVLLGGGLLPGLTLGVVMGLDPRDAFPFGPGLRFPLCLIFKPRSGLAKLVPDTPLSEPVELVVVNAGCLSK